uniref:Syntaxin-12 n=1 Tax=Cacopsylla melanoneura TaxID=428564 RepID=A0A8D8US12_9HEMI
MDSNLNTGKKSYGAIDEDPVAIKNKLMDDISRNINTLIESLGVIKRYIPKMGTKNDSTIQRNNVQNVESSSTKMVSETHKKVQELLRVIKKLDKLSQLQAGKLSEKFREVVTEYNSLQKEFSMKMKYASIDIKQFEDSNSTTGDNEESTVSQMIVQHNLELERDVAIDRQIKMQQIEDDVMDVNQIMKELNAMVNQQGESIVSISDAIDRTGDNVQTGADELFVAYQRQRKKRLRKLICSGVILVILVIIVVCMIQS